MRQGPVEHQNSGPGSHATRVCAANWFPASLRVLGTVFTPLSCSRTPTFPPAYSLNHGTGANGGENKNQLLPEPWRPFFLSPFVLSSQNNFFTGFLGSSRYPKSRHGKLALSTQGWRALSKMSCEIVGTILYTHGKWALSTVLTLDSVHYL